MGQTRKVSGVATKIGTENGKTFVQYHNTKVVQFDAESVTFDTGGWFTATTRTRMNQTCNQFELGMGVFQRKGKWFASYHADHAHPIPFDGNTLTLPIRKTVYSSEKGYQFA